MMEALTRGEWKPGEAIPAERRLAERYGISIGTVRKAIDELVAENILIRQQGRGTFVASHNRDRMLFYFFHVVPLEGPKVYPDVELLAFGRGKADRTTAERSASPPPTRSFGSATCCGSRASRSSSTTSRCRGALPGAHREAVPRPAVDDLQPLPGRIRHLGRAHERAAARHGRRRRDRAAARVARGAPLLAIRRVALTYNDVPVEYRVSQVDTATATTRSPMRPRASPRIAARGPCSELAPLELERVCRTGAKLRRCAGHGPCARCAARCSGVP